MFWLWNNLLTIYLHIYIDIYGHRLLYWEARKLDTSPGMLAPAPRRQKLPSGKTHGDWSNEMGRNRETIGKTIGKWWFNGENSLFQWAFLIAVLNYQRISWISTVQIEAKWGLNPQNIWDRMWTAWGYEWFCWIPGLSLEGLYRLFSQHIQNQRWESGSPNPENILIWQIFEIWTRQDMYNWEPLRTRKRAFVTGLKGTEKFRTGFLAVILSGGSPVSFS